ncbi:MAG TPA: response regulator [Nitrospiraceae bacterium]|nr:response regulator [Nitrospiraceae bacterium]
MPAPLPQYDPRSLLNSQPVIVTVIDPTSYTVQFQNEMGRGKFGEIANERCYEKIAQCESPCSFCKMPEALQSDAIVSNEVPLPNEQYLLVQWSKTVTADGRIHVIETITDVTERKRAEAALHQAEKIEGLMRLAGGMAHDFNNLLTLINGHAELLEMNLPPDTGHDHVSAIQDAGRRAAKLTKQLLTLSRQRAADQTVVEPNVVIAAMEEQLQQAVGGSVTLRLALAPDADRIFVDRAQLQESLLTLAQHAAETMPDGGTVTIETQRISPDNSTPAGAGSGSSVQILVRDTGHGMDAEAQVHIFEPYVSTKTVGRGLGLAMVQGFAIKSGGSIDVASMPGHGTVFTMTLPQVHEHADTLRAPATVLKGGYQILLVEDEPDVRRLLANILRSKGYDVWEAVDGLDALEQHENDMEACRLVVADVVMPRMDGPTLAQRLRARVPSLKVLFISGYAVADRFHSLMPSHDSYLQKPLSTQTLLTKIQELVAG